MVHAVVVALAAADALKAQCELPAGSAWGDAIDPAKAPAGGVVAAGVAADEPAQRAVSKRPACFAGPGMPA